MNLFVMRHGQAQLHAASDSQRQLTEIGFDESAVMANWFNQQHCLVSHVIISPFLRAQQTSATFIEAGRLQVIKETSSLFVPSGNAKQCHDYIDGFLSVHEVKNLLIVSHMPLVSYLVESLTAGQNSPLFETCGVAHIDYNTDTMIGELINFVSPQSVK